MPKWLEQRNWQNTAQVNIGNDVWVGAHAIIPGDVTIGHGAVIGAGAVITKDVPPYAVISGSSNGKPKIQKYRFADEVISDLLELNWWDYDLPKMMAQGVDVPYEDIKDFISFMKNEDLSKFLMIPDDWRLLSIINQNRVQLTPGQKDMFMDFIQIELPDSEQPQDEEPR
nr:DapH/DapD/GlmU-related protein [Anaerobiospirillum sp. NML120448]